MKKLLSFLLCVIGATLCLGHTAESYRVAAEKGKSQAQFQLGECYYFGKGGVDKDVSEALIWFNKAAEQGNANAQFWVGYCYHNGIGVAKDYNEAITWYRKAINQKHARAHFNTGLIYHERINEDEAKLWYEKAFALLKKDADKGDMEAQWGLGTCYFEGKGIIQDYAEAVRWYRKAAEQGNAEAQYKLGWCYENEKGITRDFTEAALWYQKAAEQGNAEAQVRLGWCYENEKGVPRNYTEAIQWYQKAAELGNVEAQFILGNAYYRGEGIARNYAEALQWFRKAAEQGNANAQFGVGCCYHNGEGVDKDYNEAFVWYRKAINQGHAQAHYNTGLIYSEYKYENDAKPWYEKAFALYKKNADQGDAEAQWRLGVCYSKGHGTIPDHTEAAQWFRKAAEQGNAEAQVQLGNAYYRGEGVSKDQTEAVTWYRKAAEQGYAKAQDKLGNAYYRGEGVPKDQAEAVIWYRKAAERGYVNAQHNLGNALYSAKNFAEAVTWYRKAAEQGSVDAQINLGNAYQKGEGVTLDHAEAIRWYRKAAELGNIDAQFILGNAYRKEGATRDYKEAAKWYQKAAEQGNIGAQLNLGNAYQKGEGVTQNYVEAATWYLKAAEQGNADAQCNLGNYYANGQDYSEAARWYRQAAEKGNVDAQYKLGLICYNGDGNVTQDFAEAVWWFRKAAEQNIAYAQSYLGDIYYDGRNGIERDENIALFWYRQLLLAKEKLIKETDNANELIARAEERVRQIKINLPEFNTFVKYYVQSLINKWQHKGEFEKTADWQQRVKETTRQEQIAALSKEAEMMYADLKSTETINFSLGKYDPDNEVYLVQSDLYGNLLVHVPQNEAQAFKVNWSSIIKTPKYFIENDKPALAEIVFTANDKIYKYSSQASLHYAEANRNYTFAPVDIAIADNSASQKSNQNISVVNLSAVTSEVDENIPPTDIKNENTFAVIIANENYQRESQVIFAKNDGEIFKKYCMQTLGLPEKNVHIVTDATLNNIRGEINWISGVANAYRSEASIIFYYAGHGIPDESSKTAYLLPIDGYGSDVQTGYKLDDLYSKLVELPVKNAIVFMDACFSGAKRSNDMLASARGVAIKIPLGKPSGNMVVFSAAQGDETAYPYREKGHGLFTYFLLKKLQETKGDVTLGELSNYITDNVQKQSIVVNSKSQTPTVTSSATLQNWQSLKLR